MRMIMILVEGGVADYRVYCDFSVLAMFML